MPPLPPRPHNHTLTHTRRTDKHKVARLLLQLVTARLSYCRLGMGSGTLFGYRILMATSGFLLSSLEIPEEYRSFQGTKVITEVKAFLKLYRFRSLDDGKDTGWTPLRFAALHANGRCIE